MSATTIHPTAQQTHTKQEKSRKWTQDLCVSFAFLCGVCAIGLSVSLAPGRENFNWGWPYWAPLVIGGAISGYGEWRDWFVAPLAVGFGQIVGFVGYCLFAGTLLNPFLIPMGVLLSLLSLMVSGPCAIIGILAFGVVHPDSLPDDTLTSSTKPAPEATP